MSHYPSDVKGQEFLGAIDVTLNSRYYEGQYQVRRNQLNEIVDPIMVHQQFILDEAGEPLEQLPKLCPKVFLGQRSQYVENNQQYPLDFYRGVVDEQKAYIYDRHVQPKDGLLHFYSKNQKSRFNIDGQKIKGDKVQMLVSVTCYNETFEEVRNTLAGIHRNLIVFKKEMGIDEMQVVVIVFQDGVMKMDDTPPYPQGQREDESSQDFERRLKEDRQIDVIGKQPITPNDEGDIEDLNYEDAQAAEDQNTLLPTMREWFYATIDVEMFKRKVVHPLHERQQVIYHEAKYCVLNGLKMPQEFPSSLPRNVALLYQTQLTFDHYQLDQATSERVQPEEQGLKMTTFFLLKHTNAGKLSSQMWLFQGFCPQFKPKYIAMVDVGTIPDRYGLVNFYRAMEHDSRIGGVSGYIQLYEQRGGRANRSCTQLYRERLQQGANSSQEDSQQQHCNLWQTLRRALVALWGALRGCVWELFFRFHQAWNVHHAQAYEITQSCVLDKHFESLFGYLQVLPGAWCAYRREALFHSKQFSENLLEKKYLKMVLNPARKVRSVQEANMYLAEDRILCLGIVAQDARDYILVHVTDAIAETDSVPNFMQLLRQRRRWINSTWFALEYVLRSHAYYLERSAHSFWKKFLWFPFLMLLTRISRANQYLIVAFYYVVLHICTFDIIEAFSEAIPDTLFTNMAFGLIPATYIAIVFYIYVMCLTLDVQKPMGPVGRKNQKSLYAASSIVGVFQFFILAMVILNLYDKFANVQDDQTVWDVIRYYILLIVLFINLGAIPFLMLMHLLVWPLRYKWRIFRDCFIYVVTYFYYSACYNHVLVIFSFCHIDDVSWGTKGKQEQTSRTSYRETKNSFVTKWFFWNLLFGFLLVVVNGFVGRSIVLYVIILYATITTIIRVTGALIHFVWYYVTQICRKRISKQNEKLYHQNRDKIIEEFEHYKQK